MKSYAFWPHSLFAVSLAAGFALVAVGGAVAATQPAPAKPVSTKPAPSRPAPARAQDILLSSQVSTLLPGLAHLPADPLLVAAVQVNAVDNFFNMLTGKTDREASGADMMTGALQLLKDQMDGPLSIGLYPDEGGKTFSLLIAAHLKQSGITRELLNGFVTMGADEKNPAKKMTYKGQNLISLDLPKQPSTSLPLVLQPTFTVTGTDFLLIGTSLPTVKKSIDAGPQSWGGAGVRTGLGAMLKEIPLNSGTDVWLFMPKPTGQLQNLKTPLPLPLAGLPLGATVAALRFTPTGVRFEGLASVDRPKTTAQKP